MARGKTTGKRGRISKRNKGANNDKSRIAHLASQVFENEKLREKILTHAIQNNKRLYRDIGSIRLVQKAWMKDVTRIMKKLGKPLYKLMLGGYNSLNASDYVKKHGIKILDNFISTVALSPLRIENVVPPFSLCIESGFFQVENRQSFSNFLAGGSVVGLVELELRIWPNGRSTDLFFCGKIPRFQILPKLTVAFCEGWGGREDNGNDSAMLANGYNFFLPVLKSVLLGANHLEKIVVPFCTRGFDIPTAIKYVTLPRSLTYLKLDCVLTSAQLEGLATTSLPNLINLSLPIHYVVFSKSLIFRILDQYKETLRNLSFTSVLIWPENIPKIATCFHFPVMKCLESFNTKCVFTELNPKHIHSLQTFLPKLSNLSLTHQSVNMLRKWTDNCNFATVTNLAVGVVNDNVPVSDPSYYVTIHLEDMQALHMAFSNVSALELNVHGYETCALKYVFMEMKQLTELSIRIGQRHNFTNSNHWDSLLTGIPIRALKKLKINTQFWENVNGINLKVDERCSLKNLNELRCLRLICRSPPMSARSRRMCANVGPSLISNAALYLAFLQMPKLKMLDLEGNFRVSYEMTQVWMAEQRLISQKE